jgi:hypothetical protein
MDKISNKIIERAVELWCRKLHRPVFDNGDDSLAGIFTEGLATMNINSAVQSVDNLHASIEQFRTALTRDLIEKRDSNEHFYSFLSVDYGPCEDLAKAADEAGIPHDLFSVKSTVQVDATKVSTSFGYGAEYINHYPLPCGGWLITTLTGSDIDKITEHVCSGNSIGFEVEK